MRLEYIKDSNNYKYYKKMIKFARYSYLGAIFVLVPFSLIMNIYDESYTVLGVMFIVFMSIWHWPFYLIYNYKINKMVKNKDEYILTTGIIEQVLTIRGRNYGVHKVIVINSGKLNKKVKGDLFKGETFKTIDSGQSVEFLYNPKNNHVLIIGSMYNA